MEERITPVMNTSVKLIIGLFFTGLGLLLTLDNLNLINADLYLRYWPLIFVAIGIVKLTDPSSRLLGVAAILGGAILLALNTRAVRFFDLWPLLLIGAGVFIVMQAFGVNAAGPNSWPAILSQRRVAITDQNFKGGRIVAIMGGCVMDLTAADLESGPAVIEMLVLMGGVDMRIPDGWEVVANAVPFMGGIDVKTRSKQTGKQLILQGFVMMGGVEVQDAAARIR